MATPYSTKPDTSFWRRAVTELAAEHIDPVLAPPFVIARTEPVATIGSCFAQHIAGNLRERGFSYMVTEREPLSAAATDENYGVFPARFGNVYTVRQLLQLLNRAYGLFAPADTAWVRADGRVIDPFRPLVQSAGFASVDELEADRAAHLAAVRRMFEECRVLVVTLGLTEGWLSAHDGAVFPIVPQAVASGVDPAGYRFHNFTVAEMSADLAAFIRRLRCVNPGVRIVLTVSPVALIATFEDRHVLLANTYSKAALRVVAEEASRGFPDVAYFPAFEIITGPHARSAWLAEDLRAVRPEGVAHVMSLFARHYLANDDMAEAAARMHRCGTVAPGDESAAEAAIMRARQRVICDEAVIETSR